MSRTLPRRTGIPGIELCRRAERAIAPFRSLAKCRSMPRSGSGRAIRTLQRDCRPGKHAPKRYWDTLSGPTVSRWEKGDNDLPTALVAIIRPLAARIRAVGPDFSLSGRETCRKLALTRLDWVIAGLSKDPEWGCCGSSFIRRRCSTVGRKFSKAILAALTAESF